MTFQCLTSASVIVFRGVLTCSERILSKAISIIFLLSFFMIISELYDSLRNPNPATLTLPV